MFYKLNITETIEELKAKYEIKICLSKRIKYLCQ